MQAAALTVAQAAEVFGTSVEVVEDLVEQGGLYRIQAEDECRLPIFQLDERGHPVPHVQDVLPHLGRVHPVGVLHWFTEPNPDLASEATHYASLSPKGG